MIPSNPWPSGYGINTGVTNPLYGGLPEIEITTFTGYLGAGNRTRLSAGRKAMSISWITSPICAASTPSSLVLSYLDIVYDGQLTIAWPKARQILDPAKFPPGHSEEWEYSTG